MTDGQNIRQKNIDDDGSFFLSNELSRLLASLHTRTCTHNHPSTSISYLPPNAQKKRANAHHLNPDQTHPSQQSHNERAQKHSSPTAPPSACPFFMLSPYRGNHTVPHQAAPVDAFFPNEKIDQLVNAQPTAICTII